MAFFVSLQEIKHRVVRGVWTIFWRNLTILLILLGLGEYSLMVKAAELTSFSSEKTVRITSLTE